MENNGHIKKQELHGFPQVRSILLRGFDQQMAGKIGEYMEEHGVNMVRECVPESIEKIEEVSAKNQTMQNSLLPH